MQLAIGGAPVTTSTLVGSFLTGADAFSHEVFTAYAADIEQAIPDFAVALKALREGGPSTSPDYGVLAALGWWAGTLQFSGNDLITTPLRNALLDIGERAHALPSFSERAAAVQKRIVDGDLHLPLKRPALAHLPLVHLHLSPRDSMTEEGGAHTCVSHPFRFLTPSYAFGDSGAFLEEDSLWTLKRAGDADEKITALLLFMGLYASDLETVGKLGLVGPVTATLADLAFHAQTENATLPLLAAKALFAVQKDFPRVTEKPKIVMDAIQEAAKDPRNIPLIEQALDGDKRNALDLSGTALDLLKTEVLPKAFQSGDEKKISRALNLIKKIDWNNRDNLAFDDIRFSLFGEDRLARLLTIDWQGDRERLRKTAFHIFDNPRAGEERRVLALLAWFATRDTLLAPNNVNVDVPYEVDDAYQTGFVGEKLVKWTADLSKDHRGVLASHLLNHLGPVKDPSIFLADILDTLEGRKDIDSFSQIQLIRAFRHQVEEQHRVHKSSVWASDTLKWGLMAIGENRSFPFSVRVMAYEQGTAVASLLDPEGEEAGNRKAQERLETLLFKDLSFAARFKQVAKTVNGDSLTHFFSFDRPNAVESAVRYLGSKGYLLNDSLQGRRGVTPVWGSDLAEDMGTDGTWKNPRIDFRSRLWVSRFPKMGWLRKAVYRLAGVFAGTT